MLSILKGGRGSDLREFSSICPDARGPPGGTLLVRLGGDVPILSTSPLAPRQRLRPKTTLVTGGLGYPGREA